MKKRIVHIVKGDKGGLDFISRSLFFFLKDKFEQKIIYFCKDGRNLYKDFDSYEAISIQLKGEIVFVNLFNFLRELRRAEFIHVHHTKTWLLFSPLLFFHKKMIYTFHMNFGVGVRKNFFEILLIHLIVSYCSIFSVKIIVLTDGQRQNLLRYSFFKMKFENKVILISNFIDDAFILKIKAVDAFKVLYIGRYTPIKGFRDFESLAREMPEIQFYSIGNNEYISKLRNLANYGEVAYTQLKN